MLFRGVVSDAHWYQEIRVSVEPASRNPHSGRVKCLASRFTRWCFSLAPIHQAWKASNGDDGGGGFKPVRKIKRWLPPFLYPTYTYTYIYIPTSRGHSHGRSTHGYYSGASVRLGAGYPCFMRSAGLTPVYQ